MGVDRWSVSVAGTTTLDRECKLKLTTQLITTKTTTNRYVPKELEPFG
jgi:hypothetical protein